MAENVFIHPALTKRVKWIDFPPIEVLHPVDLEGTLSVTVSDSVLLKHYQSHRRTAIWQAWCHFTNTPPPIPNAAMLSAQSKGLDFGDLRYPVAVFQGLKRPHGDEENGDSILAYVTGPTHTMKWHSSMTCVATIASVPPETVFVTYLKLAKPLQNMATDISGRIIGWEFIPSDPEVPAMPDGFAGRYGQELWRR